MLTLLKNCTQRTPFVSKRLYASKPWTHAEATQWQREFQIQNIPKDHISISFSRSSGPGGQNVNKGMSWLLKLDYGIRLKKKAYLCSQHKGRSTFGTFKSVMDP